MRYQRAELPLKIDGLAAARTYFAGCIADSDPQRESLWVAHVDDQSRCLHVSRHEGDECTVDFPLREIIKDAYGAAYMLGRGGRFQMSYRDWSYLGRAVSEQYRYLNNFAAQVVSRPFNAEDVAQAVRRANLYPLSARQVMQRGYTYARGVPELPYYPGDGSTPCLGNCGCHWDIEETATGWDCYWRLGKADNCEECPKREVRDSPLRVAAQG